MKKMLFVFLVLAVVVGCSTTQEKALALQSRLVARMSYFQDPRSHVCYSYLAATDKEGEVESYTAVPCTDEVRALLPENQASPSGTLNFLETPRGAVLTMEEGRER